MKHDDVNGHDPRVHDSPAAAVSDRARGRGRGRVAFELWRAGYGGSNRGSNDVDGGIGGRRGPPG